MDGIEVVALIVRWLHISAVVVAIGGAVFSRFVLSPAAGGLPDDAREQLLAAIRKRWAIIVHSCIMVLVLTGGYNWWRAYDAGVPSRYQMVFGIKFILVLGVFTIAIMLTSRRTYFKSAQGARSSAAVLVAMAAVIILLSGILRTISASV